MEQPSVIRLHFVCDENMQREDAPRCQWFQFEEALWHFGYVAIRQRGSDVRITTLINGEHHEVILLHSQIRLKTL